MTEFDKVGLEIVKFMRGNYRLDEVPGKYYDADCLKFRQGSRTIVTVNLYVDHYEILIILGKAEREKFEAVKQEFPIEIQHLYDQERTLHDGKWLLIRVADLQTLDAVKRLILIKKKPNRRPIPKENATFGKCGHRCDLCVHHTGIAEDFRNKMIPHLTAVYGGTDWRMTCTGCDTPGCHCCGDGTALCAPLQCLRAKKVGSCLECEQYPCEKSTVGYHQLEHRHITADDVTMAILPYVPYQYEHDRNVK